MRPEALHRCHRIFGEGRSKPLRRAFVLFALAVTGFLTISCRLADAPDRNQRPELVVAAAANLTETFREIGEAFTQETGIEVLYNFGATTQLMQQISNGAPFDVFAAADTIHLDQLVESGKILPDSRAVYARGRLALWIPGPEQNTILQLSDLVRPSVRFIAIANPDIAPFGLAAVEVLEHQNLWSQVQPKIVYAENVNAAKQLAATGNAEAAFTAYSLLLQETGLVLPIDESLHSPIDQALGIVVSSSQPEYARRYTSFVLGGQGVAVLRRFGYSFPPSP